MFIRFFVVDHHNLTGYSQIVEELDATGAVVAIYHYGHDLISQSKLLEDPASGASDWQDRIFLYDGGGSVRALTDLKGNITAHSPTTPTAISFNLHPSSFPLLTSIAVSDTTPISANTTCAPASTTPTWVASTPSMNTKAAPANPSPCINTSMPTPTL